MKVHGDTSAKVGFTFSFGVRHVRINQAVLLHWTKSFRTGLLTKDPVVGRDIVALLTEAFKRRNMPCKVVACLNDSTGTLITGAYESSWRDPKCIVGMIIGTGYNMCYVEPEAESFNYIGSIINIESGSFGRGLPRTAIDYEVDLESSEEGLQQLEKMVSGLYVGELCRHLLLRVFQASVAPLAWKRNSLSAEVCLTIFNDDTPDLTLTATALKEIWHWDLALEGRKVLKKCVTLMVRRSAALVATIVAAVCYRTRYLQPAMGGMTIAVDGSLYTQNPLYRDAVRSSLALILGSELCDLIKFQVTSDGSGRGAAILACIEDNADS
ncbi:MAG: uncharacterized protein KVP18_004891 [Porospora cf. gigantea A]|nr:MAG: hypothetical protein KVP18_004891 [Porospora cf. gigantea A]